MENWRSRNLGRKVAMPATMDDTHTWDRTTSRKMGCRRVRSSTLGKTVGVNGGEGQGGQPLMSFTSVPSCPVQFTLFHSFHPISVHLIVTFNSILVHLTPFHLIPVHF